MLLLGALAGGFVSGLAGFGTGLMALGIWLYVVPPAIAVPLVLICSIIGQTSTLLAFWRFIDIRLVWPFIVGGLAGVPLGTLLIAHADPAHFKLGVGLLLLQGNRRILYFQPPDDVELRRQGSPMTTIRFAGGFLGGLAGLFRHAADIVGQRAWLGQG